MQSRERSWSWKSSHTVRVVTWSALLIPGRISTCDRLIAREQFKWSMVVFLYCLPWIRTETCLADKGEVMLEIMSFTLFK